MKKTQMLALFALILALSSSALAQGYFVAARAQQGPARATVLIKKDQTGQLVQSLSVTYVENTSSNVSFCHGTWTGYSIDAVFVVGNETVVLPMNPTCRHNYQDPATNYAQVDLNNRDHAKLWDKLFPVSSDGTRWFALQVAFRDRNGNWDSRYGDNYRLILK